MKNNYFMILLSLISIMICIPVYCQVGIGTTTPRGALDINSPITNNLGLVLPVNSATENILNPQGGTIAEGTIMYDSTNKCVKYFNGNEWSNCLCDTCNSSSTPTVAADCSQGFSGIYQQEVPLSGATYKVTLTNNSFTTANITFQTSDLVLSGVDGITVASVTPTTATIQPGASQIVTYNLSGTPATDGTLNGVWNKITLNCTNNIPVDKMIRVAYWSTYSLGSNNFSDFNSQLINPINYGKSGTHTGNFEGFVFKNITSTLSTLTVEELIDSYDIISIGYDNMSIVDATKIRQYVDGGGLAVINFDSNIGTNIFNAFGGTGNVGSGVLTAVTNTNSINNGIFGNSTNVSMAAVGSFGFVNANQLASNSTILATNGAAAQVFLMGTDDRAIFFWDEGVFRHSSVSGNVIDTPQEIALHNYISYMLRKKGY
ncbi:hypothetical protein [Chishuiella changwenlii]|uniref:hypothetical protein n=1 Tax=Chishuiella changwenlii TaxID=1434701 RepID=UPI002FDA007C